MDIIFDFAIRLGVSFLYERVGIIVGEMERIKLGAKMAAEIGSVKSDGFFSACE